MKEFFEELMYMCSPSNTTSRGFYIFIAIAMATLAIGAIAMLVLMIVNLVKFGAFAWYWAAIFVFAVAALVGLIIWLKRS